MIRNQGNLHPRELLFRLRVPGVDHGVEPRISHHMVIGQDQAIGCNDRAASQRHREGEGKLLLLPERGGSNLNRCGHHPVSRVAVNLRPGSRHPSRTKHGETDQDSHYGAHDAHGTFLHITHFADGPIIRYAVLLL